jgi:hypothetical protein
LTGTSLSVAGKVTIEKEGGNMEQQWPTGPGAVRSQKNDLVIFRHQAVGRLVG